MALTASYLTSVKNLESILNSIITARAPERFTTKFLEDLGFKSSTDRLIVGILKALGLLDEGGVPTQRYFEFLDQSQSKKVIAVGIQEAYEDLFNLRIDAQNMNNDEIKNKLKTLTQGQKSERVIEQMALTFRALCHYAEWNGHDTIKVSKEVEEEQDMNIDESVQNNTILKEKVVTGKEKKMELHYNIQVHLPETTNMAVYDAIFQSLKRHLI